MCDRSLVIHQQELSECVRAPNISAVVASILLYNVSFNYTILTRPNPTDSFLVILTNKDRTMAQDMQSYVQRNDYSGAIKSFSALELQVRTSFRLHRLKF